MTGAEKISRISGVGKSVLEELDAVMSEKTGRTGILDKVCDENEKRIDKNAGILCVHERSSMLLRKALREAIWKGEAHLLQSLDGSGADRFEKAIHLAREVGTARRGFFLKKSIAQDILRRRPPHNLIRFLGYRDVAELLEKHDVTESFSALRFIESIEWMHETFDEAYNDFTEADFEEREIELAVLGPVWREVAERFVAKKHHNVSHLKEFGVIFLNPIAEEVPGTFLRDFALLLHYLHEIEFYSKLFRQYAKRDDFTSKLKMLLRGDVNDAQKVAPGEWLIVQRYLFKENQADPRLALPRVNPESLHWARGEMDLVRFAKKNIPEFGAEVWEDSDWMGDFFEASNEVVSFDLEDNAMSAVAFNAGQEVAFDYHQREALWTKLFKEYVGGEDAMEKALLEHFDQGLIRF